MKLAKPCLDVALMTSKLEESRAFWEGEIGLPFEETLRPARGVAQHRFGLNGSVLKVNHVETLPRAPLAGYRELWIAKPGLASARSATDPDGNRVRLVPPGERGVEGIAVGLAVRDAEAHAVFFDEVLPFERTPDGAVRCGHSKIFIERSDDATSDASITGPGYRYLTIQIFDCRAEHEAALARGAPEGAPPRRAGDVAIYSMVRDPDGNWIELSQRASLTGSLG